MNEQTETINIESVRNAAAKAANATLKLMIAEEGMYEVREYNEAALKELCDVDFKEFWREHKAALLDFTGFTDSEVLMLPYDRSWIHAWRQEWEQLLRDYLNFDQQEEAGQ